MAEQLSQAQIEDLVENGQFGLKASDLTEDRLKEILRIYDQTVGAKTEVFTLGDVTGILRDVKNQRSTECRFGSRLTRDSKLWIEKNGEGVTKFRFDDNISYPDPEQKAEAEKLTAEFRQTTNRFIHGTGVGIPLSK